MIIRRFALLALGALTCPAIAQYDSYLGVTGRYGDPPTAFQVEEVTAGTAAERIGLATGDLIVEFEGRALGEVDQLVRSIRARPAGTAAVLAIRRGESALWFVAVLGDRTRPDHVPVPDPTSLLAVFERLARKAERRYLAGEYDAIPALRSAAERAHEAYRTAALEALPEGERAAFETQCAALESRLAWFDRQASREAAAPIERRADAADAAGGPAGRSAEVERLVRELDDPDFATREAAARDLAAMGPAIREELEALLEHAGLEARNRGVEVLDRLAGTEDPDRPAEALAPVEAEVLAEGGAPARLAAVHGALGGPRSVRALLVRGEAPVGPVELAIDGDGRLVAGTEALAPGDRLVWIDGPAPR